jgi:predicted DNA-binding protein
MENDKMVKDAAISIRVEPDLKKRLEAIAAEAGMTLAAYAEGVLDTHSQIPQWQLADPEVFHSAKLGTAVKLNVAEGWPVCIISPARAEKLALDLIECARMTKRLSQPQYDVYAYRLEANKLLIVGRDAKLPKNFRSDEWRLLKPPSGVAPDIAFEVETKGFVVISRTFSYRPEEMIGSPSWSRSG